MTLDQLKNLILSGESHNIEFKKSTSLLKPAFESVCAFLNDGGGIVIIGANDKGDLVGQNVTDTTRQEIANHINKLEPAAKIKISYVETSPKNYAIVLQIPEGKYVPYTYDGRPYLRTETSTIRMPQHYYEQLIVKRGHLKYEWDESLATGYDLDDLDHEEILKTIRLGVSENRIPESAITETIPQIMTRLKLMINGQLTNAAVVLLAKDVLPIYPQCEMKMARFKGTDRLGNFLDNRTIQGNAYSILSEAMTFIRRHLPIKSHYTKDSLERIDRPAIPNLAIREALINALCHKDYSNRSSSISLAIYDDRLELWNYGDLPKELSLDDLSKAHESYPRNKLIASQFYMRGLIEKWGTGTLKMQDLCDQEGLPEPVFETYSSGFSVKFFFETGVETTADVSPKQQLVLDLLGVDTGMTLRDLTLSLNNQIAERSLRRYLSELEDLRLIEVRGQTNARSWFLSKK